MERNILFFLFSVPIGVPLGIQATPHDSRTLTLDWNPPLEESQNGIIIHYNLSVSVSESGQRFDMAIVGETAVTLQDLHPYYEYNYAIAAATSVGTGPFSERNSIRMPQDGTFNWWSTYSCLYMHYCNRTNAGYFTLLTWCNN